MDIIGWVKKLLCDIKLYAAGLEAATPLRLESRNGLVIWLPSSAFGAGFGCCPPVKKLDGVYAKPLGSCKSRVRPTLEGTCKSVDARSGNGAPTEQRG